MTSWLGVALYLVAFFCLVHLVDRLAARPPSEPEGEA